MCRLCVDDQSRPPLALVAAGRPLPPRPSRRPRPLPHRARVPRVQVITGFVFSTHVLFFKNLNLT